MTRPTNRELLEHIHRVIHHEESGLIADLRRIKKELRKLMATAAEIKTALAEGVALARANNTLIGSFKELLTAATAAITGLEAQVAALVADNANDVGSDDVAEISATITELKGVLDEQKALLTVQANTPEDPNA